MRKRVTIPNRSDFERVKAWRRLVDSKRTEQLICNQQVIGSNPLPAISKLETYKDLEKKSRIAYALLMHLFDSNLASARGACSRVSTTARRPTIRSTQAFIDQDLDERFFGDVLGFDVPILQPGGPLGLLRKKLTQESSIRGGK